MSDLNVINPPAPSEPARRARTSVTLEERVAKKREGILSRARKLQCVVEAHAALGKECLDVLLLASSEAPSAKERRALRKAERERLEADMRTAGLAPDVNRWVNLSALCTLEERARKLPLRTAYALLPLCRYGANDAVASWDYDDDKVKGLLEECFASCWDAETARERVKAFQYGQLSATDVIELAKDKETREAKAARKALAELLSDRKNVDVDDAARIFLEQWDFIRAACLRAETIKAERDKARAEREAQDAESAAA